MEELSILLNPFNIIIPDAIGKFSASLKAIVTGKSQIKGRIPMGIGSLKNLNLLLLRGNSLTGNIPSTFGGLESLQRLFLKDNMIEGLIPEQLCQLKNLEELLLSNNSLWIHTELHWKPESFGDSGLEFQQVGIINNHQIYGALQICCSRIYH